MKSQDTTPQPDSLTVKPFQISPFQTRRGVKLKIR